MHVPQPYVSDRRGFNLFGVILSLALFGASVFFPVFSAAAAPVKILAFGDSLVAGYGLADEDSFPARLQAALGKHGIEARITNAGVSGDTTAGGLARADWVMQDKPDLVILELGANDGLRGIEPSETRRNLDSIIAKIKARGAAVLLTGMKAPPNLGDEYAAEFNNVFPALAKAHKVPFYPFFLDGVAAIPSLNQSDGIHPNAKGVAVIVEGIVPAVKRALAEVKSR